MNEYQKVLVILQESATISSKTNKLLKIEITTEDHTLAILVRTLLDRYKWHVPPGRYRRADRVPDGFPTSHKEWLISIRVPKRDLENYCMNTLAKEKPQWQILAERHGWKPGK